MVRLLIFASLLDPLLFLLFFLFLRQAPGAHLGGSVQALAFLNSYGRDDLDLWDLFPRILDPHLLL